MKNQKLHYLRNSFFIIVIAIIFTSCANVIPIEECITVETYGFLGGLFHGIIAPFSFIGSLFDEDIAMYAVNNNGAWYNFGFVLGAGILFGGGGKAGSK
ncbi:MAG: hypothetical protein WD059_02340 [Balneolaceae bacterium]